MNKCPKCDKYSADGFDGEGAYTPGLPCSNCGHQEENGPTPSCPRCGTRPFTEGLPCDVCVRQQQVSTENQPPPASPAEEPRGVMLRLVPPSPPGASIDQQRANCRKILLEALTRIENGEVDELVLVTVNSKQAPSPYTLRWQFVDPIRVAGLLGFVQVKLSSPPFVTMT